MPLANKLQKKISTYQPSEEAKEVAAQTKFLLVAGPAGSGKSAIISKLLQSSDYQYITSHTTRPARTGETAGEDFFFINEEALEKMLDEQQLIEVETIYGEYASGTSVSSVREVMDNKKIGVADIDVSGVKTYMKLNPNTRSVFILPPSYEEWLRRLAKRGSGETQEEIRYKLETAQTWLEQALSDGYWHFVINTDVNKAVDDIKNYASGPESEQTRDDQQLEHAWHVLGELKTQLNS